MSALEVTGIDVRLAGRLVLEQVSLRAPDTSITAVIGPNGSGKSTLLRSIYRHITPSAGSVTVGDRDLLSLSRAEAARTVSAIPQERGTAAEMTVYDTVALGRIPYQGALRGASPADREAITDALRDTGLTELAHRSVATLSGGERQRVHLARAIAQDGEVVVLDEPTNHLDPAHQVQLLALLRQRARTTVITLHDLSLAATCDHLYVLDGGRVVADGDPRTVLTADLLHRVYGVRAALVTNPLTGGPLVAIDYAGLE